MAQSIKNIIKCSILTKEHDESPLGSLPKVNIDEVDGSEVPLLFSFTIYNQEMKPFYPRDQTGYKESILCSWVKRVWGFFFLVIILHLSGIAPFKLLQSVEQLHNQATHLQWTCISQEPRIFSSSVNSMYCTSDRETDRRSS